MNNFAINTAFLIPYIIDIDEEEGRIVLELKGKICSQ